MDELIDILKDAWISTFDQFSSQRLDFYLRKLKC